MVFDINRKNSSSVYRYSKVVYTLPEQPCIKPFVLAIFMSHVSGNDLPKTKAMAMENESVAKEV